MLSPYAPTNLIKKVKQYFQSETGVTAATFAIMLPLIVASVGLAVDLSNAYTVQKQLGYALDASALAAASSSGTDEEIEQRFNNFMDKNYTERVATTDIVTNVVITNEKLSASAETRVKTSFMRIFNKDYVDIFIETEVTREVRGVEVVLVLDNTGSMASNNNIATLREASENFVNILFDAAAETDAVRIGIVPYSTSVNVGPYGLGEDTNGAYYDDEFVNNPHDLEYSTWNSNEWQGCVLAEDYPLDVEDHEGPWDMYRYCRNASDDVVCDYYTRRGRRYARRNPNYICPETPVVPLTSDQNMLLDSIDTMEADGWTLGNYGLTWGWRLISPEFPFREGAAWDDNEWEKVVIMMTDGINTMHYYYTAYGRTSDHDIDASDLNDRMAEVCEAMKEQDITLYTVTFAGGVNEDTKDFFRECATTPEKYYDAPTQDELIQVFEKISRELSNLHISK